MKECPHCGERTFGPFQLWILDYFSVDQCKRCRKWVRNDGLRQLLIFPAVMCIALVLALSVSARLPMPLGLLAVLAGIPTVLMLLAKPVKAEQFETRVRTFTPDQKNDKIILVSGWSEAEVRKIVADYFAEGQDFGGPPAPEMVCANIRRDCHRLTFPEDIDPDSFVYLVNQFHYPLYVASDNREIMAAGLATLNRDFEGIPESLAGQKAVFYVPENDEEHVVVYLQTDSGINLANTCGESEWRSVPDARYPRKLRTLIDTVQLNSSDEESLD
jgi:hypothetical protein